MRLRMISAGTGSQSLTMMFQLTVVRESSPAMRRTAGRRGSVWGAEESNGCTEGIFQGMVAAGELGADTFFGLEMQPGVSHGVIANAMSGGGNGSGQVGLAADIFTDEEEGGANIVTGQEIEKGWRGERVGAVIEGEGEFLWAARGYEDGAVELGGGVEGGVGGGSRGQGGGGKGRGGGFEPVHWG